MIRSFLALTFALAATLPAATAHADGVTVTRAQFTSAVERGVPVGDASTLAAATRILYWVECNNPGAPAPITLVWSVDGRPVQRQTLDVGHAPRWRVWGMLPRRGAGHTFAVTVLDAAGATLHTDTAEVR